MSFDLTGYEKRVPDESEIESAFYTFSGMTDVTTDDADTIRRLTAAHQAIVKNRNEQVRIADASDADTLSQSDHDDIEPFSLRLTYYLKDGSQLSRSYSLYLRRSDLTVPSSVTARVNALYMCRESVLCRVLSYGYAHLGDTPRFLDSYCYYYDENSNTKDYALTAAHGVEFPDAYYYDDLVIYANHSSGDFLNVTLHDGTWEYSFGRDHTPVFDAPASGATEDMLREELDKFGFSIPADAAFTLAPYGETFYRAVFSADLLPTEGGFLHGTLTCDLRTQGDGQSTLSQLENRITTLAPVREEPRWARASAFRS